MALPYFYEPTVSNAPNTFVLSEETSKHCVQVLRMKENDQMQLTDGKGNLFTASVIKPDKKKCEVKIHSSNFTHQPAKKICIAISLLKNASRFEWFLEKATELGISEIIPLLCQRTERQHFRFDRMNAILVSAMLQSQQTWLPVLHAPSRFDDVIRTSTHQQKLIAHCEESDKQSIPALTLSENIQLLIGPEGDFSHEEIEKALKENYNPVSLGNTRLRTETAGISASVLLINLSSNNIL